MGIEKKWGLILVSVMFLKSALVHGHNQTTTLNVTASTNSSSTLEEIVPGSLKIGTGNVFAAPDLFGGEPFSLKTDPVTGEVDFQTRTVDMQTVKEARDREEAQKIAELQEDIQSRVSSSADLPLEAREEEYEDLWDEPERRRVEGYYHDEEEPQAREPIMVSQRPYSPRPTTPKEEDSFMSIFESLFGGGEEEKKSEPEVKPTLKPYGPTTTSLFTTPETYRPVATSTRKPEVLTTERRQPLPTATERQTYQKYPDRYNNYQRPPERHPMLPKAPERYDTHQQLNRPNSYQQQRIHEIPRPHAPERPPTYQSSQPERPHGSRPKPVHEVSESFEIPPKQSQNWKELERPPTQPQNLFQSTSTVSSTEKASAVHQVTPQRPSARPVTETEAPKQKPTTEYTPTTKITPKDWSSVEKNELDNNKENIDRQDTFQNEVTPKYHNQPDYFNFINLPVHYSTKDTAIPLISNSYANTKVQGMGASKYEKNNGKYSNHKYDPSGTTTRKPSYWPSKRPIMRPAATATKKTTYNPDDFKSLEYDDAAIGSSADFGGYGNKAGVKVETEATKPPTYPTPIRTTSSSTTLAATTVSSTTTSTTMTAQKLPINHEYEEYEYEASYPAQVESIPNPSLSTKKPYDTNAEETRTTFVQRPKVTSKPKEPEYEYYDYDTEAPAPVSTTTITTTTTATTSTSTAPSTTSTQKYKLKYPSLSKDKIKHPEEKVEVVVPIRTEATSPTSTSVFTPSTTTQIFPRPTTPKEPAPVFEEPEDKFPSSQTTPRDDVKPIIVTAGKKESDNINIVLVPAKNATSERTVPTAARRPESTPTRHPALDYTTEFTVGVIHGQGPAGGPRPEYNQGHFVASSIAASPYDGPDEPFRPIAPPAGMSASFQVVGDDSALEKRPEKVPEHLPNEPDAHEPHEFIPSPQFHRPDSNHFVIGTSFNTQAAPKPSNQYKEYQQTKPAKNEILSIRPKPQRPIYNPPPSGATDFFHLGEKPKQEIPNLVDFKRTQYPTKEEDYYKVDTKPVYEQAKPAQEEHNFFDIKPEKKPQTNVELSVDYDFDGIQTEPKPGQYVIFPKPQLNSEMNENQVKKIPNTPIPHYHEPAVTEPSIPTENPSFLPQKPDKQAQEFEKQQEISSNYPRPHWEKNGKPNFLVNTPGGRNPLLPPQMSSNLMPPGNIPPKFRKPVSPANLPPVRKTHNEANFPMKPKPNLPNILPQFRPNAKIGNSQRPTRPMPPNRRKENFPYRIQNEPDTLMHRDFEVEDEIMPKFITNRVKLQEYDPMMIQKRFGVPPPPPAPSRVQRTPVTTLQMLQQTQGIKKQKVPSTREDQVDPLAPLVPPSYKPYKDEKKDIYVVYPVKTPFNSNIKIEDPDKIDYTYNQTYDQVPLLKPSKKRDKLKQDFPYGFVTPEEKVKGQGKQEKESQKEIQPDFQDYQPNSGKGQTAVRPNIQDYMPSGVQMPNDKQEKIDMNLHMQSNNQWNQVSNQEVITRKEESPTNVNPPTQYHTVMKNTNASEFTLGAVMHTLPEQNRKGQVTSVNLNEENTSLVRPGLNVNERISNGKIVTVSMPLDVKDERKEEASGFQAPFQASSSAHANQGWNILEQPDSVSTQPENVTEQSNTKFNFENFTPELIGGFKPIYNSPDEEEP